jgi:hypothetical protein
MSRPSHARGSHEGLCSRVHSMLYGMVLCMGQGAGVMFDSLASGAAADALAARRPPSKIGEASEQCILCIGEE